MKGDKKKTSRLLKTAKGQIEGILKMIEDDRYCIDISNQLLAVEAIIRKANKEVIRGHMKSCIKDAMKSGDEDKKIEELMNVIDKLN
ncbi:metal-sensing transcriptional repressor [Fusobacterium sp. PH5-44]|uniref:metal-sensing transcriptional repressor n=1 Tax=unclassified Fusobacterium TaxID=2648384 RepID=UPI003D1D2F4D